MTTKKTFRVWIKKNIAKHGSEEFRREISAAIEDLQRKYPYSDGKLNRAPAWVFEFPDSDTAYDFEMGVLLEIDLKYGENVTRYFSFEDNLVCWECHKNAFLSNPGNRNKEFYKLWTEE